MRLRLLTVLMTAIATLGLQFPATASTGGTPDGEAHPNVGILFAYSDGVLFRCSGTLVSPTVLLTAGHCTEGVDGVVLISFESEIAETREEFFAGLPEAQNPDAGYTAADAEAAGFVSGTAYTHPEYSGFTDLKNWNDVGVVELDEAVTSIAPATIAPVGTLDGIAKLTKTLFTAVGYGTEVRQPESGPQKAVPETFPLLRRSVTTPGQKLTPQIIQTSANPNDNQGTGGSCTGDSGGPLFYNDEIVALTSYGNNDKCLGVGGYQRVDIAIVQDWLAEFGL